MNKQTAIKMIVFAVLAAAFALLYVRFGEYASLERIKQELDSFRDYYAANRALVIGVFFAVYVAVAGLSLPGAALMTLLAGALFGVVAGVILPYLNSAAHSQRRQDMQKINDGIEQSLSAPLWLWRRRRHTAKTKPATGNINGELIGVFPFVIFSAAPFWTLSATNRLRDKCRY